MTLVFTLFTYILHYFYNAVEMSHDTDFAVKMPFRAVAVSNIL